MRALAHSDLLGLWEVGSPRHRIDRALLLCAWARSDLAPAQVSELPVSAVNEILIRLRSASFGSCIQAWIDCPYCRERLEFDVDAGMLLAKAVDPATRPELEVAGFRFRVPAMCDLAAIAGERDAEAAALQMLQRCCVARPAGASIEPDLLLGEVENGLERIDPMADIGLDVSCSACAQTWTAAFDIASLLWDEIAARARALLAEVHVLARAYGWSESEILGLSAQRRAAYLDMVSA